jgi:hypothetical protein
MNCFEWEERVALHAGGDLADSEAQEVERHLADCPGCQVFWSGLRESLATLQDAHSDDVPAAVFTAVRAGVLAEIERGRRVWRRLAWVSGVGIAAMVMVGLAIRPGPLPGPPPRVAMRIPAAPVTTVASTTALLQSRAGSGSRVAAQRKTAPRQPVLVKLQTADPKIVIYWIAD